MTKKEYLLIPFFEKFIKDSYKGKRLKTDGGKIKTQTINNYVYVIRYLKEYEIKHAIVLRIRVIKNENKRDFMAERNYWKKFYLQFTQYLYSQKNCFDNYVGTVIKTIRVFFNYLNREAGIKTGDFYKSFYVNKEEVPIITLMPQQLQFLINDKNFEESLSPSLQKSKAILVFGCTVALRISDLFNIKFSDIEKVGNVYYLPVKTLKTGSFIRAKLPEYAVKIIEAFKLTAKKRKTIFPPIPPTRFNSHLKEIAEFAGWVQVTGKQRTKRGVLHEIKYKGLEKQYRFCDLVSSHIMRRTAITTMLMMGMKEHVVKKISGHTNDSKSFYRYVNLVQSYLDNEMDEMFDKRAKVC
ncbi:MAG: tyrosine-type recombinase/integrase [Ferruginibacter sp.]